MSQRERDRLKVLEQVAQGQIRQRRAAQRLRTSERGLRKLLARYRAQGDRAVVHGLPGTAFAAADPGAAAAADPATDGA